MMDVSDAPAGLATGPVVLGAMTFGSQVDDQTAQKMVDIARDAGVTMFDTSNNYNAGRSEEILGKAVQPFRDRVLLATKVGSAIGQGDGEVVGLTRTSIVKAVEGSLRRLGTDYIDLYYFHRPDWNTPIEESLEAADHLVRSGKVRNVGQSNFAAWQVTEMAYVSERQHWPSVRVSQIMYNLLARRVETEYAACSRRLGLVNIAYNPLAGGMLTGKHSYEHQPPPGTRFDNDAYRDRYWSEQQFNAVAQLQALADEAGSSLTSLALRWLRDRPLTDSILIGASSVEQLTTNLDALSGPALDPDLTKACDATWLDLGGVAPHYNR